jgi:hypothetical protein
MIKPFVRLVDIAILTFAAPGYSSSRLKGIRIVDTPASDTVQPFGSRAVGDRGCTGERARPRWAVTSQPAPQSILVEVGGRGFTAGDAVTIVARRD